MSSEMGERERELAERYGIVPTVPYGRHIPITCRNHPHLRWSTKNVRPIGARTIVGERGVCDCHLGDLIPAAGLGHTEVIDDE